MDPLIRIPIRIRLVVGLINALVHEREEDNRVLNCVNEDTDLCPIIRSTE